MPVPLKGSTAGPQYAGWEPRTVARQGLGNRALTGQRVPVAGGVSLNADVYTPAEPGRYPAVVAFSAYSTETHTAGLPTGTNEAGSPPVFTDRGYCPVLVERRGMGRSGGDPVSFFDPRDVDDHEAVIAWAAEQPWCNGEVVLFGTSYYAISQVFVAARRPPALRAFFAHEPDTDELRHAMQFGGVPGSFFLGVWLGANFTAKAQATRMSPTTRALFSHVTNGPLHPLLDKLVHRGVSRTFQRVLSNIPTPDMAERYARWMFDEKTRETSTAQEVTPAELARIDVPFVTVQNLGYLNLHQFGSYDLFEHAGTPDADKWLILGPPMYDLPVYEWQLEALAFFDHVLHGSDNGYADQPHVRYWVDGAARFDTASSFPPDDGEVRRLYLRSAGADHITHRLTPDTPPAGQNSWAAVPRGVPVLGGLDEIAPQVLSFDLPVTDELQLAGPVTAQFSFSSNEIDSYVVARLTRIDADGAVHQLSMGAIRPVARTVDPARGSAVEIAIDSGRREPLVPGEPVDLRFSLTAAPVSLRAGETLRLDVASRSDLLREDPSNGYAQFDLPVPPYLSRNTLHFGGASWIEVTAVPLTATPTPSSRRSR
ncbi:CocE/NonD family hydrolase [Actinomycetospora sp. C-140]